MIGVRKFVVFAFVLTFIGILGWGVKFSVYAQDKLPAGKNLDQMFKGALACSSPDCNKDPSSGTEILNTKPVHIEGAFACFTPDCYQEVQPAAPTYPVGGGGYVPSTAIASVVRKNIELQSMEREDRLKPIGQDDGVRRFGILACLVGFLRFRNGRETRGRLSERGKPARS